MNTPFTILKFFISDLKPFLLLELQAKVNTLKAKAKELETDYHIKYKSIAERQHKKEQQD
jgi:hypothetical protein